MVHDGGVHAQNRSVDRPALAMLKAFYTAYITEVANLSTPIDLAKTKALQQQYCTARLLSKINAQLKRGQLDADPFLQAQDADLAWLTTLSVTKEPKNLTGYTVSYRDEQAKERVVIHLTVTHEGERFKIAAIR